MAMDFERYAMPNNLEIWSSDAVCYVVFKWTHTIILYSNDINDEHKWQILSDIITNLIEIWDL